MTNTRQSRGGRACGSPWHVLQQLSRVTRMQLEEGPPQQWVLLRTHHTRRVSLVLTSLAAWRITRVLVMQNYNTPLPYESLHI